MTLEQTRQLGIEFERRVQTMIPETEFVAKLDSETIFSFLNQYQDKLIHETYRAMDQIPRNNNETYIETLLQGLLSTVRITSTQQTDMPVLYSLPTNFGLYVNSVSEVSESYEFRHGDGAGVLSNQLIASKDVPTAIQKAHDGMKIIRHPIVYLTNDHRLAAIYDRYTTPQGIRLQYYKVPTYMDLMTSTPCELPMEMFEQLVSGAVDLYVDYVAGAEARKRQMNEQARQQQQRRNDDDNERS